MRAHKKRQAPNIRRLFGNCSVTFPAWLSITVQQRQVCADVSHANYFNCSNNSPRIFFAVSD